MKPNDVGDAEENKIVDDSLEKVSNIMNDRPTMASPVRIRLKKEIFDKGTQLWSEDLYDIVDKTLMGRYIVKKQDSNKPLKKTFRYEELQPINVVVDKVDVEAMDKKKGFVEVDKTIENRGKLNAIRKAVQSNKIDKKLKQVGIDLSNIVSSNRVRKSRKVLDL
jgi:hypothetical protein